MGQRRLIWRGEVYDVGLGEPAFARPGVVVSVDTVNNGPGALVIVVPVGSVDYALRSHIELEPGLSGLDHTSYARCDQLRVISIDRLSSRRGMVPSDRLRAIDQALRFVLDL